MRIHQHGNRWQSLQNSVRRNQETRRQYQRQRTRPEGMRRINFTDQDSIKELNNASISACQQYLQVHDGNDLEGLQSKV